MDHDSALSPRASSMATRSRDGGASGGVRVSAQSCAGGGCAYETARGLAARGRGAACGRACVVGELSMPCSALSSAAPRVLGGGFSASTSSLPSAPPRAKRELLLFCLVLLTSNSGNTFHGDAAAGLLLTGKDP